MALNKVEICGVNTAKLPILSNEEKEELFRRIKQGDQQAREEYIKGNLRLVLSVIKRFSNSNENADDLFQIGCIGLIKAIDNFDTTLDVKFSTYAVPMITGEIKRFLRDDGMMKVSRSLKEICCRAYTAREELMIENGREPEMDEIAERIAVTREELVMAMESGAQIESLQKTIYQGDGTDISLEDKIEEQRNDQEHLLNRMMLEQMLGTLNPEERKLIYMRFFQEKTQTQIAGELGISQVQVSRLEKKILNCLREKL